MDGNDKQIIEECIEDKNLHKLLRLPASLDVFSEAAIVKALQFVIKCDEAKAEKATKDVSESDLTQNTPWTKEGVESPHSQKRCYILNTFLRQRFSPRFLQEEAREMSFDCVLILSKYLHFLLSWSPIVSKENSQLPSLEQVIDWLNCLIDSHFQQLRLAEDAKDIIGSLYNQVTDMTKGQSETKALLGTLAELNRQFKERQRNNNKIGDYCIEVITF